MIDDRPWLLTEGNVPCCMEPVCPRPVAAVLINPYVVDQCHTDPRRANGTLDRYGYLCAEHARRGLYARRWAWARMIEGTFDEIAQAVLVDQTALALSRQG